MPLSVRLFLLHLFAVPTTAIKSALAVKCSPLNWRWCLCLARESQSLRWLEKWKRVVQSSPYPRCSSVSDKAVAWWGEAARAASTDLTWSEATATELHSFTDGLPYAFIWIKSSTVKEIWGNSGSRLTFPFARRGSRPLEISWLACYHGGQEGSQG